jgi:membrane-bound lytic murein transglycosylase A
MRLVVSLFLCALLSGCAALTGAGGEGIYLQKTQFADLPGWEADDVAAAFPPLAKSCAVLKKDDAAAFGAGGFAGTAGDWRGPCAALKNAAGARAYFEENFSPYAVFGDQGREGLFTGYYEPVLRGSYKKRAPYLIPLYARPADLVTADLGAFRPELKGESITGRVTGGTLVPYYDRAQIGKGAIRKQKKIVWVDSAVDAFFLHIQGSGLVRMTDGSTLHVGYAAQNGLPYTAIGREMLKRGLLEKGDVSMQSIRAWLEAHPKEAPQIMNVNVSYVFFRALKGDGPLGAQGVALTPGRSLAVDRKKIPYGAPLWLDAEDPNGGRLQRLMIAQDTGGAIRGAVRGDFFWGPDAEKAGKMKSRGQDFILLPKTVAVPPEKTWHLWRALLAAPPKTAPKTAYNR